MFHCKISCKLIRTVDLWTSLVILGVVFRQCIDISFSYLRLATKWQFEIYWVLLIFLLVSFMILGWTQQRMRFVNLFQLEGWQAEALDLGKTVLQTVEEAAEDWRLNDIKSLLGRCNFKSEMVHRKVEFLSGGEKVSLLLSWSKSMGSRFDGES